MADNSTHHPQRVRTYAADLAQERSKRGLLNDAPSAKKTDSVTQAPTPIAAAPKPIQPVHKKKESKKEEPKSTSPKQHTGPTLAELSHKKPVIPSKIPAFHELQKSAATIQENITAEPTPYTFKKSEKTAPSAKQPRPNLGYDATIITDTKTDRFDLFSSISTSIRGWFKNVARSNKQKKTPKYMVPETERRKGVIQRATSKTGTIFTADSETLKEQIRRRHLQEQLEDEAETIWSPFTETGYTLLEAPDTTPTIQNVTITYKKQLPVAVPPPVEPIASAPAPSPLPHLEKPPQTSEEEVIISQTATEPSTDSLTEARWDMSEAYTGEAPVLPSKMVETPPPEEPTVVPDQKNGTLFSTLDTNTLTVLLLFIILGLVTIVFVARVLITNSNEVPTAATSVEVPTEPILSGAKLAGITLTVQTLQQVPQLLERAISSSSPGVTEYAVVSTIGDEVSASYLFELLGFHTTPHLRQSITTARFATNDYSKPAIILQFTDTDAVRGGLLAWEASMATDILPLYDASPLSTITPFTDQTIAGFDTRVLHQDGIPVIVYGIIGRNTAIITSDTTLFTQLVERSFSQ